jgi:hypothetical protein
MLPPTLVRQPSANLQNLPENREKTRFRRPVSPTFRQPHFRLADGNCGNVGFLRYVNGLGAVLPSANPPPTCFARHPSILTSGFALVCARARPTQSAWPTWAGAVPRPTPRQNETGAAVDCIFSKAAAQNANEKDMIASVRRKMIRLYAGVTAQLSLALHDAASLKREFASRPVDAEAGGKR